MKKRINIYVNSEAYKKFKIMCIEQGFSVSEKIDEFIRTQISK